MSPSLQGNKKLKDLTLRAKILIPTVVLTPPGPQQPGGACGLYRGKECHPYPSKGLLSLCYQAGTWVLPYPIFSQVSKWTAPRPSSPQQFCPWLPRPPCSLSHKTGGIFGARVPAADHKRITGVPGQEQVPGPLLPSRPLWPCREESLWGWWRPRDGTEPRGTGKSDPTAGCCSEAALAVATRGRPSHGGLTGRASPQPSAPPHCAHPLEDAAGLGLWAGLCWAPRCLGSAEEVHEETIEGGKRQAGTGAEGAWVII